MHVIEVGASNLIKQRNGFHTPVRHLAAIDLSSHLLPYSATHIYTLTHAIYAEMDYDNAKRLKSSSGSPVSVKRSGATALPQYQPPPAR